MQLVQLVIHEIQNVLVAYKSLQWQWQIIFSKFLKIDIRDRFVDLNKLIIVHETKQNRNDENLYWYVFLVSYDVVLLKIKKNNNP